MKDYKPILIAFLLGVSIYSIARYSSSIKEKHILQGRLQEGKIHIMALKNEEQNLLQALKKERKLNQKITQKNLLLKKNLKAAKFKIAKLFREITQADKDIEELNSQLCALKAENTAIRQEEEKLKLDLAEMSREKDTLKVGLETAKKPNIETVSEGNKGFLIKDGASVSTLKVKIDVKPVLKTGQ